MPNMMSEFNSRSGPEENFDSQAVINLFTFFLRSLLSYTQSLARQTNRMITRFIENFQLSELFDIISDKFVEYPPLRFVILATALSCAVPVVMFIVFGVTSILITFAGFLFIEGTLLAVGGLCMFACITSLVLVLSILAVTLGVFCILTAKLGNILNRYETTSSILRAIAPSLGEQHLSSMPGMRH